MNHRKVYKLNSNNNIKGFNTLQKKKNSVFHTIKGRHRILNLWVSIFPKSVQLQQLVLLILKKVFSWFYLRSWQRRPSGKQSLPVPLSGSLPQSSGNSGSFPVATGASVPSSTNVGGLPMMFWKKFRNTPPKNGNWALAAGRRMAAKRKHWSLIIG